MNVVNRLTLRHLKLNAKRTLVTIIGVILSVSMITAVATFSASIIDLMRREVSLNRGHWHALFPDISPEKLPVFTQSSLVKETILSRDKGYALLEGGTNSHKPYLFIREYNPAGFKNFNINLLEGRMPTKAGEVLVSEHIWTNGGVRIRVGDRLSLEVGQRLLDENGTPLGQSYPWREPIPGMLNEYFQPVETVEYIVTGVISRPSFEPYSAPGYTVLAYLDADSLGPTEQVNVSILMKKVNKQIYSDTQQLAELAGMKPGQNLNDLHNFTYPVQYNRDLLAVSGVTGYDHLNYTFTMFSLIAIIIIMVGSISLIYNAFAISIAERSRHLGMLASVGATASQKRRSVFFEGAVIGLISIPLGILAGTLGLGTTFWFINPLLAEIMNSSLRLNLVVSWESILIAVGFSILTIYISAWIPARRAARISPVDALRQAQDVKLTAKAVKTSRLTRFFFGFEAELALKNLKRNRRRYRATVFSLVISMVLYLTVASLLAYIAIADNMAQHQINYDLGIHLFTQEDTPPNSTGEFLSQVAALPGIKEFSLETRLDGNIWLDESQVTNYIKSRPFVKDPDGRYMFNAAIHALDDAAFARYAREVGVRPEDFGRTPSVILVNRTKTYDFDLQKFVDSQLILATAGESLRFNYHDSHLFQDFSLAALTDKVPMGSDLNNTGHLILVLPKSALANLTLPDQIRTHSMLFLRSTSPIELEQRIFNLHREIGVGQISVDNVARTARITRNVKTLVTVFTTGFIVLISSICIANILNTITTSIALRRREFAMLKSVGMTPHSFGKMINFESIFYGIKALCFGLPISFAITVLLYKVMSNSFRFPFTMPWGSYLVAIAAVFAVVFTTMLYSSSRIKRENIIDALKTENI